MDMNKEQQRLPVERITKGLVMPIYDHDCDQCRFIKTITVEGTKYDVYQCTNTAVGESTWLARYDDRGGAYWSMPWDILKTANPTEGTKLLEAMQNIARQHEEK